MPQVGIVMGSDSDLEVMGKARDILDRFGIESEMRVISAHREPDVFYEYAKTAQSRGLKIIIAGAGMAARAAAICASCLALKRFMMAPIAVISRIRQTRPMNTVPMPITTTNQVGMSAFAAASATCAVP